MDTPITRAEHEEFKKRLEEHNSRQDKRLLNLEDDVDDLKKMTISIEKLATNMESMMKELQMQGNRLEIIENRDGEMWRKVVGYIVTAIIGIIVGYIFQKIGMN